MFNLLVNSNGWGDTRGSLPLDRVFKYTANHLPQKFQAMTEQEMRSVMAYPSLFMPEIDNSGPQLARVGSITRARVDGTEVQLDYMMDGSLVPIPNSQLAGLVAELDAVPFELRHTHWAVKEVDLFRVLFRAQTAPLLRPKVFGLDPLKGMDLSLVSAMMPFDRAFDEVWHSIQTAAATVNLKCQRASDIWQHDAIIQDIVSLIHTSRIVVCDCTRRNANVFYEIGIAHSIGRDVILITQSASDVPFDLRHLRFIEYLDNDQGRKELVRQLSERMQTLAGVAA